MEVWETAPCGCSMALLQAREARSPPGLVPALYLSHSSLFEFCRSEKKHQTGFKWTKPRHLWRILMRTVVGQASLGWW